MIGALTLCDVAQQRGLHVTYFGTGCIYTYDDVYPMGYAVTELDPPNFSGSFYSRTKGDTPPPPPPNQKAAPTPPPQPSGCVDRVIQAYDNVLCLRYGFTVV